MHTQVDTGSNTIFRFDNVMDPTVCNMICEKGYTIKKNKSVNNEVILPWEDNDTMNFILKIDEQIKPHASAYSELMTKIVNECYKINSYVVFEDLVMWRKGRKMFKHKDNGYDNSIFEEGLKKRKISTVLYLNDNYTGGETFIKTEHGTDYISKPKQGTVVTFLSDETNEHGVNEITDGIRFTLPIWFGIKT